jgi:hypothetical protein
MASTAHPMDFNGPAPLRRPALRHLSIFADVLTIPTMTHRCLPNMLVLREDANTRLPRTAITCLISQHSSTFIKQISICSKNDVILTTVHRTNDARPPLPQHNLPWRTHATLHPNSRVVCKYAPGVAISMELSMNNRQPSTQFFSPVTRRFSSSESTHAPRGGV